jgi:hypothetical protein
MNVHDFDCSTSAMDCAHVMVLEIGVVCSVVSAYWVLYYGQLQGKHSTSECKEIIANNMEKCDEKRRQ